ncbi:hypothetical protein TRFO_06557 [Tritrichomonas foetus]|uniref:DUF3447 domain-containing protein n=1 Tax=Tritrichomonas foetus TaxID=1144522 RepID=A0A1J4K2K5_9EUKA|nr:hypothetical protein TRFO_06557 [Tritrichomonas foetus]|eukprot:OHT03725.1 hypothetical protein TRFO_06557 [Tritrichomonas foetus]
MEVYLHNFMNVFEKNVQYMITIQDMLLDQHTEDNDSLLEEIQNIVNKENILEDKIKFTQFLHMLQRLIYICNDKFNLINDIILSYKEQIQNTFCSHEVYSIFFWNRYTLLKLFENRCIDLQTMKKYSDFYKFKYFLPEFRDLDPDFFEETTLLYQFIPDNSSLSDEDFKRKRELNHSDEKIAELIREDNVEEFIEYISQTNKSIDDKLTKSTFESNWFIFNNPTLYEYAAFFQSMKIFKYLTVNHAKITSNLPLFAVAGGSYDIIHMLEDLKVEFDEDSLIKGIEYHRNEIVTYLHDTFSLEYTEKCLISSIKFYNFHFLIDFVHNNPKLIIDGLFNCEFLHCACTNSMIDLINFMIELPNFDINMKNENGVCNS